MPIESPLRQILLPYSLDLFLAQDYERRAARFPHDNTRRVDHLVSCEEVDRVLWSAGQDLAKRVFRRSPQGSRSFFDWPPSEFRDWLLEGYRQGMSIVVPLAQSHFPALARLNRAAAAEFESRCSTTIVLSPDTPEAKYEDQAVAETLLIQVRGEQLARLSGPPCGSPLDRQLRPTKRSPSATFELAAHDVLYVPGGRPFELRPCAGRSLHVQLHIEKYRWVNLLEDMIEAAACEAVALRGSTGSRPTDQPGAILRDLLRDDAESLVSAALSLKRRRQVADSEPLPGSLLTDRPACLTEDAWVELADGSLCHVARSADRLAIEFAARRLARVSGPAFIEPALRFIAARRAPFRVADIPGLGSLEEKLVLANRLIEEGLLTAREPG